MKIPNDVLDEQLRRSDEELRWLGAKAEWTCPQCGIVRSCVIADVHRMHCAHCTKPGGRNPTALDGDGAYDRWKEECRIHGGGPYDYRDADDNPYTRNK